MASQLDLDQGNTVREMHRVYLGPSVGWVDAPYQTVWTVLVGGTTVILPGINVILVSFNGAVTVQLPSAKPPANAPAIGIPVPSVITPILVFDFGGFAGAHPITVLPAAGETIDSLASVTISSAFGTLALRPNLGAGSWIVL